MTDAKRVADALVRRRRAVLEAEDKFVRALRASREYSWTEIANLMRVSRRTAIYRWGHYPGGLPTLNLEYPSRPGETESP